MTIEERSEGVRFAALSGDARSDGALARAACVGSVRSRSAMPDPRSSMFDPRSLLVLALLVVGAGVHAQEFPKLKAGLWEMERSSDRPTQQPNRMTMCLDDSVQKQMFEMGLGAMKGMCSKHDFSFSGNRGQGDFVCDIAGSRMHSKSTIALTGNTAYRTEIRTTYDPPFMGQTQSVSVLTARHVGACKPGQRAGDIVMPNGQTFNARDAMGGAIANPPTAPRPRPPAGERPRTDRQPG